MKPWITTKEAIEVPFLKAVKNRLGKHLYSLAYGEMILRKGNGMYLFLFLDWSKEMIDKARCSFCYEAPCVSDLSVLRNS